MKKLFISFALLSVLLLAACGDSEKQSSSGNTSENSGKVLSNEEFVKMYSDPAKYKGDKVDFYARVFTEPEKDDEGTYLQVYAEDNSDRNTLVGINDPDLKVKNDDIIHVVGTVKDVFEGENLMGGTIVAPLIEAESIEITDYATAFAPALKTIEVNKEIDQHGYLLKLQKIELAENETRLYVNITNNSDDEISFYTFNSKVVIDNKQYEENSELSYNYPEIQSEILPGVSTEGIIVFDSFPESATIKVFLEGYSDNYDLDFTPFEFEVTY